MIDTTIANWLEKREGAQANYWILHEAKAQFSELIRCACQEGPQYVAVRGQDGVIVISLEEFRRLRGGMTGQALIDAMQASPHRDIELIAESMALPIREFNL